MEKICELHECTACQACRYACPVSAISMHEDERGFVFPHLDKNSCINCGKCRRVCPSINKNTFFSKPLKTFAGWTRDEKNRWYSTSGGASFALSQHVIEMGGGVFCGVRWNTDHAEHTIAKTKEGLHQFQGSKYTYSDVGAVFLKIQQYLKNGRIVYFVGTACQVAGLRAFLSKTYDNLLTIDVLCHGIPSMKGLRDRIRGIEKEQSNGKVIDVRFRDKDKDQHHTCMKYTFENGKSYYCSEYQDLYYRGFGSNYLLRESCFHCKYARQERVSDITIADFWGYFPVKFSFRSFRKGVSLLLANTQRGLDAIYGLKNFQLEERDFDYACKAQNNLHGPQARPEGYNDFWQKYMDSDDSVTAFENLAQIYFPPLEIAPVKKNDIRAYKNMITQKSIKGMIASFIRDYFWWTYRPIKNQIHLYKIYRYRMSQVRRLNELSINNKHVFYLGITEQPNLGDMAQHYCIKNWISENYPDREMVMFESKVITDPRFTANFFSHLKRVFNKEDIIVIQSGYCTQDLGGDHPLMHRLVCDYMTDAKILMMPQTIFFKHEENRRICAENHNKARNMLFLARDHHSYKEAMDMFPNIKVMAYPDIVTTLIGLYKFKNPRNGVCLCTRNDGEKLYTDEEISKLAERINHAGIPVLNKDTQGNRPYNEIRANLKYFIEAEIESYSRYKVTITDRYHGTIFSLCAGTPVIILKTTDHKVTTGADWFKGIYDDYVYVANDLEEAYTMALAINEKKMEYTLAPYFKSSYYDRLKGLL